MSRQLSLLDQGYYTPQEKKRKQATTTPQPRAFGEVVYPPDVWLRCSVCNDALSTARLWKGRLYCGKDLPQDARDFLAYTERKRQNG